MRKRLSLLRRLGLLSVPTLGALTLAGPVRGQTQTQLDYTGSLMGYYRMEFDETTHLPPVTSFLKYRQANPKRLLVAMGDNFGPEFGASLQLENDTPQGHAAGCFDAQIKTTTGESRPESLYKNDNRVASKAECDNVLNFLMQAGFRAVVPGTQDFMYTARWLRVSALLLTAAYGDATQKALIQNPDQKLYLLGANLRISMKGGGGRCPLLFSQQPFDTSVNRCVGDGTEPEPLDWLDRLDRLNRGGGTNATIDALQELATESTFQVAARESALDELVRDEVSILLSAWGTRMGRLTADKTASAKREDASQAVSEIEGKQALTPDAVSKLETLLGAVNWVDSPDHSAGSADQADFLAYRSRLITLLDNFGKRLRKEPLGDCQQDRTHGGCYLLTTEARAAAINGLLRTVALEEKDIGYTVATSETGGAVLIVGVLGADTMNAVSETNLHLCPGGQRQDPINAFGPCPDRSKAEMPGVGDEVMVSDPVSIAQAIVRGAGLLFGSFERVVVMAQMPHTEAEILAERVWKQLSLAKAPRQVDVVLSEAESGYDTSELTLSYPASAQGKHSAPVVTPDPSYSSQDGSYPGAVSSLLLSTTADQSLTVTNQLNSNLTLPKASDSQTSDTTISLLYKLIAGLQKSLSLQPNIGTDLASKQRTEFALLEDLQKASKYTKYKVDVVLLQSRDVELGAIGQGYTDYGMCNGEGDKLPLCELRSALDRIFWKGDYLEYVAVTGKNLKDLLSASEKKMAEQAQLADTGPTGEWLISFGIVQSSLTNITEINENNEPVWIPVDPSCKGPAGGGSTYCIGGVPIADDSYYWLLTTDQLAQDKALYGTLESLPSVNHKTTESFVTAPLSHFLLADLTGFATQAEALAPAAVTASTTRPAASNKSQSSEGLITADNEQFQQTRLFQVDFAKLIASFTSRQPVGGNQFVGNYFVGVSDARASAPASQDLDLEMGSRVLADWSVPNSTIRTRTPISVGQQSAFTYNRAVLGNLTPSTKSINASYSLNNLTVGGFLQLRLDGGGGADSVRGVRSLPRNLLVLTPHQYQVEIDYPYLFFPFASSSPVPGEVTVQLPRTSGWTDRAGFRREFGASKPTSLFGTGSYFETGMEFTAQNNVLSALTLKTGTNEKTCHVNANITLQTCFSQAPQLVINNSTVLVGLPLVKDLHSPGVYWTLHFQNHIAGKAPAKQLSLVTDSQGDYYFGRTPSAELPTQTEYAIPLSLSLVFPTLGNLSFAPTYSGFFYQSQLSSQSLQVNSFSLAARWYFARDARVPVPRQAPLTGPASADQTRTGSGH